MKPDELLVDIRNYGVIYALVNVVFDLYDLCDECEMSLHYMFIHLCIVVFFYLFAKNMALLYNDKRIQKINTLFTAVYLLYIATIVFLGSDILGFEEVGIVGSLFGLAVLAVFPFLSFVLFLIVVGLIYNHTKEKLFFVFLAISVLQSVMGKNSDVNLAMICVFIVGDIVFLYGVLKFYKDCVKKLKC